jgi:hypothetical protein
VTRLRLRVSVPRFREREGGGLEESRGRAGPVRRSRESRGELERRRVSESESGVDEWTNDRASR